MVNTTYRTVESETYYSKIGIIAAIKRQIELSLNKKLVTIATGSGINLIPNFINIFDKIDVNLTLKWVTNYLSKD
jgi:pantothenate kinase type III